MIRGFPKSWPVATVRPAAAVVLRKSRRESSGPDFLQLGFSDDRGDWFVFSTFSFFSAMVVSLFSLFNPVNIFSYKMLSDKTLF
jgi:hypothetical protein